MKADMMANSMLSAQYVIGLDIGDGESALAWSSTDQASPSELYQRDSTGETSILTALARAPRQAGNKYLFGEEAVLAEDSIQFAVNFKEKPVSGEISDAVLFGQAMLKEFFEANRHIQERCLIFIGHPAGWPEDVVDEYRHQLQHLLDYLGSSVYLLAESQSALVYVRERSSGHPEHLDNVLVVDIGSSTVDVTIVEDMIPRNIDVGVDLGCRHIDEQLAAMTKTALAANAEFTAALTRSGGEDFLLFACRRAKEAQFAHQEQELLNSRASLHSRSSLRPDYAVIASLGFGWVKGVEIPKMVTGPGGWGSTFVELISRVKDSLTKLPDRVVLTGGGSRMPFVRDICVQAFPDAIVDLDREASWSVARGLASAGRQRVQVARFRRDVSAIATSIETSTHIYQQADRAFQAIKKSVIEAMRNQKQGTWPSVIEHPPGREQVVAELQSSISGYLVPQAQEICAKYNIDSSRFGINLELPQLFATQLIEDIAALVRERIFEGFSMPSMPSPGVMFYGGKKAIEHLPRDPKTYAIGVAVIGAAAGVAAGAAKVYELAAKWNHGRKIIERVREAELSSEDAKLLVNNTVKEIDTIMNKRASAVERFVT